MTRQHYGALGAAIVGYVLCRLLDFPIIDVVGSLGGHARPAGILIGATVAAVPFFILLGLTVVRLGDPPGGHHPAMRAMFAAGWLVAGAVMGVLPYSRMSTSTNLMRKEVATAPGFLHGLDMSIGAGLVVTVYLLVLFAPRRRGGHPSVPYRAPTETNNGSNGADGRDRFGRSMMRGW